MARENYKSMSLISYVFQIMSGHIKWSADESLYRRSMSIKRYDFPTSNNSILHIDVVIIYIQGMLI